MSIVLGDLVAIKLLSDFLTDVGFFCALRLVYYEYKLDCVIILIFTGSYVHCSVLILKDDAFLPHYYVFVFFYELMAIEAVG